MRSAELYEKAVQNAILKKQLDGNTKIKEGDYVIVNSKGNICYGKDPTVKCTTENLIEVEVEGEIPEVGSILHIGENNTIEESTLYFKNKQVTKKDGKRTIEPKTSKELQEETKMCKFVDGKYGSKGTIGAKYKCDVDPTQEEDYYFYILEKEKPEGYVTLIMDRNYTDNEIPITTYWCDPNGANPKNNACNYDELKKYIKYLKNKWINDNISIGIPSLDQIAKASNIDSENCLEHFVTEWLGENILLNDFGYWTSTKNSTVKGAYSIYRNNDKSPYITGGGVFTNTSRGFRPIIIVSSDQLN